MKKTSLLTILVITCSTIFGQSAILTTSLLEKLETAETSELIKVNIVFVDQVHHGVLNAQFKVQNINISERAKTVIRKSMQLSKETQQPIVEFLTNNSNNVKWFKQYWIINMMSIEATKDVIETLSYNPSIDYIEEYDNFKSKPIKVLESKVNNQKSIGGNEPGLAAINAPALWAMGYSGKGRRYYSIDTGIWPNHPAISDGWLGNYQPINQAWYGIDSPTPVDKGNSHGTHTAGTVLGLDPATSDTIGVAFDAYVMAADPIVTNLAFIKPLPEYIDVFEFALNPDGDTNTTDDIPDAINNSWGISGQSHDTSICSGYVTQMFDAIEAAGIANVFSAGNNGPSDTTIGQPQYVSTGLVNTFTVGAINGALPTYPIASFSSHGPTACPLPLGPLRIKPEVVAPGMNVRSCVEQNNYASYNGTSMAGPHVTGSVVLLKQAYPSVSGEEILLALYNTAIDLGVAGEDNTYGRGMIDVLAAYNELALTNTPVPANQFTYDITVDEILSPKEGLMCTQTISPKILLKNNGVSSISNATITYRLNDEASSIFNWTGVLNTGDTASVNLPSITALGFGDYELIVKAEIDTNNLECDYINNQRVQRFNIRTTIGTLPYYENFENIKIDSSEWIVRNPDNMTTWDTTATFGLANSTYSATMQMYDYGSSNPSQLDELVSVNITLPAQDSIFLKFDLAYQLIHWIIADTLKVFISDDCGVSFTEIYNKYDTLLQTHDTVSHQFVPLYPHHWRTEYIDITTYASSDVILKFVTSNKSGNNLYLDNIWLYEGAEPVGIVENSIDKLSIYPNPASDIITLDIGNNKLKNASIEIIDLLGKSIFQNKMNQKVIKINLASFSKGVYLLKFSNDNGSSINKIVIQ